MRSARASAPALRLQRSNGSTSLERGCARGLNRNSYRTLLAEFFQAHNGPPAMARTTVLPPLHSGGGWERAFPLVFGSLSPTWERVGERGRLCEHTSSQATGHS